MADARTAQICDLKRRRPTEYDWPQSLFQRVLRPVLAKEKPRQPKLTGLIHKTQNHSASWALWRCRINPDDMPHQSRRHEQRRYYNRLLIDEVTAFCRL